MDATKCCFHVVDGFVVGTFVDFAVAMGTGIEAGFEGDGDQLGETFEEVCAELFACLG